MQKRRELAASSFLLFVHSSAAGNNEHCFLQCSEMPLMIGCVGAPVTSLCGGSAPRKLLREANKTNKFRCTRRNSEHAMSCIINKRRWRRKTLVADCRNELATREQTDRQQACSSTEKSAIADHYASPPALMKGFMLSRTDAFHRNSVVKLCRI